MYIKIKNEAQNAINEIIKEAKLQENDILVIGCSSSEIIGKKLGTNSSYEIAECLFEAIYPIIKEHKIFLAVQCCEHLNRAIIIEKNLANRLNIPMVNVVPQPKAGGSFATVAYKNFDNPVAVEHIKADAGLDIGCVLIGMHLKEVAVPLRITINKIGEAPIICARTRPKFIGGSRAVYDDNLL